MNKALTRTKSFHSVRTEMLRFRPVMLLQKKARHRVYVRSVPAVKDLLEVRLRGAAEPLRLRVTKVVYELAANGRTQAIELHCRQHRTRTWPPDFLVPRFCTEIRWPAENCPPCIWDSVRLPHVEHADQLHLRVLNVTHEIDQAGRKHVVTVQVIDASPKRVFSDEVLQAAFCDIEPLLLPCDEEKPRGRSH